MEVWAWAWWGCVSYCMLPCIVLWCFLLWEVDDFPTIAVCCSITTANHSNCKGKTIVFQTCLGRLLKKPTQRTKDVQFIIQVLDFSCQMWEVGCNSERTLKLVEVWLHGAQKYVQDRNADNSDNEWETPNNVWGWCLKQKMLIYLKYGVIGS